VLRPNNQKPPGRNVLKENATVSCFWSCAQTLPRAESQAIRHLRRQGFVCFYPFFLVRNKYRHYAVKPAFPGYVFIELEPERNWSPINGTTGVRRLLTIPSDNGYNRPYELAFIEELRRLRIRTEEEPDLPSAGDEIPVGTMVRIKHGPFAERIALVELSTAERLRLLVELFNSRIPVDIDVASVECIAAPLAV
jgi:transcriptional antiterminator RfaH